MMAIRVPRVAWSPASLARVTRVSVTLPLPGEGDGDVSAASLDAEDSGWSDGIGSEGCGFTDATEMTGGRPGLPLADGVTSSNEGCGTTVACSTSKPGRLALTDTVARLVVKPAGDVDGDKNINK